MPWTRSSMTLSFRNKVLHQTKYMAGPDSVVLASPVLGGRFNKIKWGDGVASLVLFLLNQALWVAQDRGRAEREIDKALEEKKVQPDSGPHWVADFGPFVATLAELLKQRNRNGGVMKRIFGGTNIYAIEQSLCFLRQHPNVWLDVNGDLSPLEIEVYTDGQRTADPQVIEALMRAVGASRGWSVEALLRPRAE